MLKTKESEDAMNIRVQLLSGKVHELNVKPEMKIAGLKKQLKVFHPSEDEVARKLSTTKIVLDNRNLHDSENISQCIPDGANLQVVFSIVSNSSQ